MNKRMKRSLILSAAFLLYTIVIKTADVRAIGPEGSSVGFGLLNGAIAKALGYHQLWYRISEIAGYLALAVIAVYGLVGLMQLIKRKSVLSVDRDILVLGCFYAAVGVFYVLFNKLVINYRPVILDEGLEASYPSSHTMLGLCVFLSAVMMENFGKNGGSRIYKNVLKGLAVVLVVTRTLSGVHWITDIIGGAILSAALLSFFDWGLERFAGKKDQK